MNVRSYAFSKSVMQEQDEMILKDFIILDAKRITAGFERYY